MHFYKKVLIRTSANFLYFQHYNSHLMRGEIVRFTMTKTDNRFVKSSDLGYVLHCCNAEKAGRKEICASKRRQNLEIYLDQF